MSLTAGLMLVAALVLAAIAAQGVWVAKRGQPRLPRAAPPSDPLQRQEPSLDDRPPVSSDSAEPGPMAPPTVRRPPRVDALIDAVATLAPDAPVSAELSLQHLPSSRRAGTKPFLIEGLNAESGEWEVLRPGQRYGEFQAGLQMANRHGAVNEIEYSEFVQKLGGFAEAVGATVDLPDMLDVVARARELDAFATQHDAQLTAVLRANSIAWSVGYVQQAAGRHGFLPGTPGRLVLPSTEEGAPPVLVLSFDPQAALSDDPAHAALRDLTLSLDVPQTPESAAPFALWRTLSQQLADDLDAGLVDDQGQPISAPAFAAIGVEIERLYHALASRDLAAGSPAARRLFS